MSRQHVDHAEIFTFAQDKVNLPKDKADEFRAQARRLRERLEGYLRAHPDFTLKKMLLSGSLAKGTALQTLNDIDVACYIGGADAPGDVPKLLNYLAGTGDDEHVQRDSLIQRVRSRCRCGAHSLQWRSELVWEARQPG
jgi:hypothetical protein